LIIRLAKETTGWGVRRTGGKPEKLAVGDMLLGADKSPPQDDHIERKNVGRRRLLGGRLGHYRPRAA
jgi:hypothetical protein